MEFSDASGSGTRQTPKGLKDMLKAAQAGRFRTLYVESLTRLTRKSIITTVMLKEMVHVHHVRVISVSEGIDSAEGNWDLAAFAWRLDRR